VGMETQSTIAVCILCYKALSAIQHVFESVEPEVSHSFVINDACPESAADFVAQDCSNPRLTMIRNGKCSRSRVRRGSLRLTGSFNQSQASF
jgi:dolichol-phosphate mannosyltransferase